MDICKDYLKEAINPHQMVRFLFHYSEFDRYFFPLAVGEALFLCAEENDFLLDGFTVRRIRDVERIEPREGIYTEIMRSEGWLDNLKTPDVDISCWQSVFRSLQKMGRNIIIESESLDDEPLFAIGEIQSVDGESVLLFPFDADGIWEDQPIQIFYEDITSVSFDTRYINVFSRYLPPRT